MADYNINADITANTKGYEAGIKKAQESTKKFGASVSKVIQGLGKNGLVGALGSIGLASAGLSATLGAVVKIAKQVSQAIGECTEAYKVQLNAERALDTAINNSPYVTGSASKRLKEFASEMQEVSNMGDEELIPFMTQLIASGRTEAETMKIIKTASDMASSGAMSFDTAVTQLNATLNGNIGRLGQQNTELKGLTEEELKQGKAVDILADKYKGLSKQTVDTKKQLKGAIGDLKETFGKEFEEAMTPMRQFFKELIQGWTDARKARLEYDDAKKATESGTATNDQVLLFYEQQLKYIADEKLMYEGMYGADKEYAEAHLKELAMEENKYKSLIATIKYKQEQEEKSATASAEQARKERDVIALKEEYLKKLALQEAKWKHIEEVTGQQISNEEKINFYQNSLVDLMSEANGQITTNNQLYKDQINIIERLQTGVESEWLKKLREQMIARLEADKEEKLAGVKNTKDSYIQREKIIVEYNERIKQIKLEALNAEEQEALKSIKGLANTEEEKTRIREYYENERLNLITNYGKGKEVGNDWEQKLREQMIARLEADKEEKLAEVENEKHANILKERITVEYNEQIKQLKLEALAVEEQEALKSVEDLANAEEEKLRIKKYYENERMDLIISYAKENKKAGEISAQSFADGFKSVTKKLTPIMKEIGKVLSSIGNIAKSMFQGGVSIFSKLFNIDIDTVLDAILKIEDKVLSFFVETLPRLPQFVASVMQSISVLLQSVLQIVTPEKVEEIVVSIMDTIKEYGPTIIGSIADILSNMLDGIINSMPDILDAMNTIAIKLAEELPNLIQKLIDLFIAILKEPDKVAQFVVTMIKMIVEVFNTLVKNIGPLLEALLPAIAKIVWEIIKALPDALISLVKSLGEGIVGVGKAIGGFFKDLFTGKLFANGTPSAPRGLAIVGEAGPELVNFRGGEQVLNNRNTQKALAGIGSGGNTFNVTFNNTMDTTAYAMMSQLRQYNRVMAINGVI